MQYDNPAARLLRILERGAQFKKDRNCRECWEELLETKGDAGLLMARLGKVMELPQETVRALKESYPNQGNTWSHWEGQVSAAFMVQNMHAEWKTFSSSIDTHSLTYLKLAADLLHAKDQAKLVDLERVSSVRTQVQAALDASLEAELPAELKRQVLRCLRRVLDALDEFAISGSVGVLEASESALGHATIDSEYKSFLQSHEVGQRALDAIAAAANLVTVSVGVPQITVALAQLLSR